jgi:SAM-dependent methyltransferase
MPARAKEWFDDESFWRDLYPFMFPLQRLKDATGEVEKVLALAQPRGRIALDLCCGPGRCTMALAKRGYSVTGVDRTKFLLDKAREEARRAGLRIEWVRQDMRDFVRPETFDLALSMFTSFGYFDDKDEDAVVLQNIVQSLKPGGVLVMEMAGKESLARIFQPTTSQALPDGSHLVERHQIFDDWTRVRNEWTLIRKGRAKSFRFHHTIYSGQELRDRLEGARFRDVKLYGDLDGGEYGIDATRLVAVARKGNSRSKRRSSRRG